MPYEVNLDIVAAIFQRLEALLGTDRVDFVLPIMVKRKALKHRNLSIRNDYSILEDLVMQDIILKYKDHKLDLLWFAYNVGYFAEDTEKYLQETMGESYESFIRVITDDKYVFINGPGIEKAS
jgi:hypothetical protein